MHWMIKLILAGVAINVVVIVVCLVLFGLVAADFIREWWKGRRHA